MGFLEQVPDDLERHGHQVLSVTNYFGPNDCDLTMMFAGEELRIAVRGANARQRGCKILDQRLQSLLFLVFNMFFELISP